MSRANWMLHSPTMPTDLAALIAKFSQSDDILDCVIVWEGATTVLSPVCTRIARTFSILQIVMQLSEASLMTSVFDLFPRSHIFLQPRSDARCCLQDPFSAIESSSYSLKATPPPRPPRVKATLTITGYPMRASHRLSLPRLNKRLHLRDNRPGFSHFDFEKDHDLRLVRFLRRSSQNTKVVF